MDNLENITMMCLQEMTVTDFLINNSVYGGTGIYNNVHDFVEANVFIVNVKDHMVMHI